MNSSRRTRPRLPRLVRWGGGVLLLGLAIAGCNRSPQLVPRSASDSLGTSASPDSASEYARQAADLWMAGGADDQAASLSARAVLGDLRAVSHPDWSARARAYVDSLALSAEVDGSERLAMANFFSRSDPEGTSWPYLFWDEDGEPRMQLLEGKGLHLGDLVSRRFAGELVADDSSEVAALFSRRTATGPAPLLMVWRHAKGGRWDLRQTLGADSLGGVGTAEFARTDSISVAARTYRGTPSFDECPTCPHVYRTTRFVWGSEGFVRRERRDVPSPYATFTSLIGALMRGDRPTAESRVADWALLEFARRFEWHKDRGRWRVAPATEERSLEMVFFRGAQEAYRVSFQPRDGDWVVSGFEPTSRSVE